MRAKPFFILCFSFALVAHAAQSQNGKQRYTDYDRGYRYFYYDQLDSAYLMFTRYINNPDDTLNKGKAYLYMGDMQWSTGDLYGAQENLMSSLRTLNEEEEAHREFLGYVYNDLGNVSLDLKRYNEAIAFYDKAMPFLPGNEYQHEIINGKATALQKKGSYREAVALYDAIIAGHPSDKMLIARAIDNKANSLWLADHSYPALPELYAALKLRVDSQFISGMTASYMHLADYYTTSHPDSALWYAQKMLEAARQTNNTGDMLKALDKLVLLNNDPAVKNEWYASFRKLNDSLEFSRDTTRNRFALIRYDVQKNKADNLVLKQSVTNQRILMAALIGLALLMITALFAWNNKRRNKIKQESEEAIRNARLKTSQKVHDVVANGLYGIMNELDHRDAIQREPLMNRIELLYEQSRNISYEDLPLPETAGYDAQVHNLLTSFANEETKIIVVGNQADYWNNITAIQKQQLQLVLRELMTNMKKHSGAANVSVIFRTEEGKALVKYQDDGRGIPSNDIFKNGLKSTVNRIYSLQGDIIFGKTDKGGVSIIISLPLEPERV